VLCGTSDFLNLVKHKGQISTEENKCLQVKKYIWEAEVTPTSR